MHRRQSNTEHQGVDLNSVAVYERIGHHVKRIGPVRERVEGGRNILRAPDFECRELIEQDAGFTRIIFRPPSRQWARPRVEPVKV